MGIGGSGAKVDVHTRAGVGTTSFGDVKSVDSVQGVRAGGAVPCEGRANLDGCNVGAVVIGFFGHEVEAGGRMLGSWYSVSLGSWGILVTLVLWGKCSLISLSAALQLPLTAVLTYP